MGGPSAVFAACLFLAAPGAGPLPLAGNIEPTLPLFTRHVIPVFSRLGCNSGSCHGAVQGKGGFRLSLFGANPEIDHQRLLREVGGRRLDLQNPAGSLLLLKPTGKAVHEGGLRLRVESREYRILRHWIARGAPLDQPERSRLTRLTVTPTSHTARMGETYRLRVSATFADGSSEDVTDLCNFESGNKELARIDAAGLVRVLGVGDAPLVARYRAEPVMSVLLSPRQEDRPFPDVKPSNFIDKHVLNKLRRLQIHPADSCDDVTFLRRVSLDVTGELPTPDEIRTFQADRAPEKRQKKIDELLTRPGHASLWATRFCDILRPGGFDAKVGFSEQAEIRRFYEWLRARVKENTPYDQLAERILLARSLEGRSEQDWAKEVRSLCSENAAKTPDITAYAKRKTLDLYWQRISASGVKGALQVAHAFLGLRLECAQCHRHPHDIWQQDDLLSFANFFMRISRPGATPASPALVKEADLLAKDAQKLKDQIKQLTEQAKAKGLAKEAAMKLNLQIKDLADKVKTIEDTGKRIKGSEIHGLAKGTFASVTSTLGKQEAKQFRLLGSQASVEVPADRDPRELVVAWLKQPDNPFFARAIVNRVWAHYFGRGIIDPPDHLSPLNPPTHPELLDELCADFIAHKYDLRHLHKVILTSRTYQQSAKTNATSRHDSANYASFYLKRLPAEVLVDALNHATGGSETYPPELHLPAGAKAMEVAGGTGSERGRATLGYAFHIFGRPMRSPEAQCDCERDTKPTIIQTLYLANHPSVQQKISSPSGRLAGILKEIKDDEKRIEAVFLWTLSRLPTREEMEACTTHVKEAPSPDRGFQDVLWGLLNTREFLLNH